MGIKPPLTAMLLLAAVYIGGAFFFVRVAMAKRWSEVALGFPPVAVFASLLGVTTVLHWDRFTHGHVSFVAWAALYFAAPAFVVAIAVLNTRTARQAAPTADPRRASGSCLALAAWPNCSWRPHCSPYRARWAACDRGRSPR